ELQLKDGRQQLTPVEIGLPNDYPGQRFVTDLVQDHTGSIWIGTPVGLYRRWSDGDAARYTVREGLPNDHIHDLLIDHQDQLWVATRRAGFFRVASDETRAPPVVKEKYSLSN